MGKKDSRLEAIQRIIMQDQISSQEELTRKLYAKGIKVTQSTLSRDFKKLNVSKMPHPELGYVYVIHNTEDAYAPISTSNLSDAVLSIRFSLNIGVLHTKSGYASAVSVIIDNLHSEHIIGTIAGDNAILIVVAEGSKRDDVIEMLKKHFSSMEYLK
ncbi:MAG: hypothetical protein KBS95_01070 [Alistipes sp.]|nr:hypothetical protein [Candidatus Alistipes equi]